MSNTSETTVLEPEHTHGQLAYAEVLIKRGEWDDVVDGAQKLQDEVNAGQAEVVGESAAIAALDWDDDHENHQARRVIERSPDRIGAVLLEQSVTVEPGARIGNGSHIGIATFVGPDARIGNKVTVGLGSIIQGEIGNGSHFGEDLRVAARAKVGSGVSGERSITVMSEATVEDNVHFAGSNNVRYGAIVREGVSLPEGATVLENLEISPEDEVKEWQRVGRPIKERSSSDAEDVTPTQIFTAADNTDVMWALPPAPSIHDAPTRETTLGWGEERGSRR